jgi:hypothetical protein
VAKMPDFSKFYQVEVRDEIAKEFSNSKGEIDDMMAGLHEIRVRRAEKKYDLKKLKSQESQESQVSDPDTLHKT